MKNESLNNGILNAPLRPGALRDCPNCRKLFSLKFISKRESEQQGKITKYRCKKCGSEFEFAQCHPPDAI